MADQLLERVLRFIESWGVWLSWLAWLTVFFGALAMVWFTRSAWRRRDIWPKALLIAVVAVLAHLADYIVTLYRSPDLSLELNPLWRNVVAHYGLTMAKWYGLTGKLLVSAIAGEMAAFYLANRQQLFPVDQGKNPGAFLRAMGNRSSRVGERLRNLFTIFAFFFAGLTFFYFYIAFQNWIIDPAIIERLPSTPAAVGGYVVLLTVAFAVLTYRAYRKQ